MSAILVALGLKSRLDRKDKEDDKRDRDISELKEKVIFKDTCIATQVGLQNQIESIKTMNITINNKLDILLTRQTGKH